MNITKEERESKRSEWENMKRRWREQFPESYAQFEQAIREAEYEVAAGLRDEFEPKLK